MTNSTQPRKWSRKRKVFLLALAVLLAAAAFYIVPEIRLRRDIRDLASNDGEVSRAAAERLSNTRSRATIRHLAKAFVESERGSPLYERLVNVLASIGEPAVGPLLRKTSYRWPDAIQSMLNEKYGDADRLANYASDVVVVYMDKRAVEPLLVCLKHRNYGIRRDTAWLLGDIGDQRAVGPLIDALRDSRRMVRMEAAASLGLLGSEEAVGPLITALGDSDGLVRAQAADALGQLGDERAVAPLVNALQERYYSVDVCAVRALGTLRAREAVGPLLERIASADHRDGGWAAWALGRIGDSEAVAPLLECLESENRDVIASAASALGYMKAVEAVEPLIRVFQAHADDFAGEQAATALGRIGDRRAAQPLRAWLQAWLAEANQPLPESDFGDNEILRRLQGMESERRAGVDEPPTESEFDDEVSWYGEVMDWMAADTVIDALAELKDPESLEVIVSLLDPRSEVLHYSAVTALAALGDKRAVEPLIGHLRRRDGEIDYGVIGALGRLADDRAVAPLVQLLDSADEWEQWAVAVALEMIGTAEARAAVDAFLGDTDLEEVARNYRDRIRKDRAGREVVLALWRCGTLEMAADMRWSRNGNFVHDVLYWAKSKGLLDQLESTADAAQRPKMRRFRTYYLPSSD